MTARTGAEAAVEPDGYRALLLRSHSLQRKCPAEASTRPVLFVRDPPGPLVSSIVTILPPPPPTPMGGCNVTKPPGLA